ncbi:MAG: hypothetical protein U0838_05700 [Chloroflexota bacterium]
MAITSAYDRLDRVVSVDDEDPDSTPDTTYVPPTSPDVDRPDGRTRPPDWLRPRGPR